MAGPLTEERLGHGTREQLGEAASGDLEFIDDAAELATGSEEEADAYAEWLRVRTRRVMEDDARFWPCVEAVVYTLTTTDELSTRQVRSIIDGAEKEQQ